MNKTIPLQMFNWHRDTRTLTAELSDLKDWLNDRVSSEVTVESHHTGRVLKFDGTSAFRDGEGETLFWEYRNYNEDLTVKIWND